MAYIPCNYGSSGGTIELLGSITNAQTAAQTFNLTQSMNKYKYILLSFNPFDGNSIQTAIDYPILAFAKIDYFKTNSLTCNFITGVGTTQSPYILRTVKFSYVDDTAITIVKSVATSRTIYAYGIN